MFFFGKKKYKQGIVDGAKPFEDKFRKQEDAVREIGSRVEDGLQKIDENVNSLYEYLSSREKAELYDLNTPLRIEDLGEEEKEYLVAALFELSLSNQHKNEYQQNYLRAVLRHLKIAEPQIGIKLLAVKNISDTNALKSILQTVLEYLFIGNGNWEFSPVQKEFLECFDLSQRSFDEAKRRIETMVSAVGIQGLSEKYGFVREQDLVTEKMATPNYSFAAELPLEDADVESFLNMAGWSNQYVIETENYLLLTKMRGKHAPSKNAVLRFNKHTYESEIFDYPYDLPAIVPSSVERKHWQLLHDDLGILCDMDIPAFYLLDIADLTTPPQKIITYEDSNVRYSCSCSASGKLLAYTYAHKLYVYDIDEKAFITPPLTGSRIDADNCIVIDGKVYFSRSDGAWNFSLYQYDIDTGAIIRICSARNFRGPLYAHGHKIFAFGDAEKLFAKNLLVIDLDQSSPSVRVLNTMDERQMYNTYVCSDGILVPDRNNSTIYFIDFADTMLKQVAVESSCCRGDFNDCLRIGQWIYYCRNSSYPYKVSLDTPMRSQKFKLSQTSIEEFQRCVN